MQINPIQDSQSQRHASRRPNNVSNPMHPRRMSLLQQPNLSFNLTNLGLKPLYQVKYNPIAEWFYGGLNKFQYNDFFTSVGREYTRDWNADGFVQAILNYKGD